MRYWKIVTKDLRPTHVHSSKFNWKKYLPKADGTPGRRTPDITPVVCNSGWHLSTDVGLLTWLTGQRVFLAKGFGLDDWDGDQSKVAFESCQLLKEVRIPDTFGALLALHALQRIPAKAIKAMDRVVYDLTREVLWLMLVDSLAAQKLLNTLEADEEFELDLIEVYSNHGKPLPKQLKDRDALGDEPFRESVFGMLLTSVEEFDGAPNALNVLEQVNELYASMGIGMTREEQGKMLGDVLEMQCS